jgi:hypothetical protein
MFHAASHPGSDIVPVTQNIDIPGYWQEKYMIESEAWRPGFGPAVEDRLNLVRDRQEGEIRRGYTRMFIACFRRATANFTWDIETFWKFACIGVHPRRIPVFVTWCGLLRGCRSCSIASIDRCDMSHRPGSEREATADERPEESAFEWQCSVEL